MTTDLSVKLLINSENRYVRIYQISLPHRKAGNNSDNWLEI